MQYNWGSIVFLLMALVLPMSALMRRRLDFKNGALMALAWVGIFGVVALFISAVRG